VVEIEIVGIHAQRLMHDVPVAPAGESDSGSDESWTAVHDQVARARCSSASMTTPSKAPMRCPSVVHTSSRSIRGAFSCRLAT
jgi:hypothetical protein